MGFLYRLGFSIRVSSGYFCIFFSVLELSLGAGLIIDFVSVRDGLIIAPTETFAPGSKSSINGTFIHQSEKVLESES